ncbi:MAG: hypothetical protein HFJ28_03965 [Clostridia bacterium]|nr:hypothetical protein [Clostridia bacterium]
MKKRIVVVGIVIFILGTIYDAICRCYLRGGSILTVEDVCMGMLKGFMGWFIYFLLLVVLESSWHQVADDKTGKRILRLMRISAVFALAIGMTAKPGGGKTEMIINSFLIRFVVNLIFSILVVYIPNHYAKLLNSKKS